MSRCHKIFLMFFGLLGMKSVACALAAAGFSALLTGCMTQGDDILSFPPDDPLSIELQPEGTERQRGKPVAAEVVGLDPSAINEPVMEREFDASYFGSISVHRGPINAIVSNTVGTKIFTGGQDGKVMITALVRDNGSGKASQYQFSSEQLIESSKPITALALSRDESKLALAVFSTVVVIDLKERKALSKLTRIKGRIVALAWDPRGESLALGRSSGDIYLWNFVSGKDAGEDSMRAVEVYEAASSPIVDIVFHPSGRAFFAAEQNGGVYLWRLLRTERELGLRDVNAVVDDDPSGKKLVGVASMGEQFKGIWLSNSGDELIGAASNGTVRRWKVRGLKEQETVHMGSESASGVQGIDMPLAGKGSAETVGLFVSAGRGQRMKVWCRTNAIDEGKQKTEVSIVAPEGAGELAEVAPKLDYHLLAGSGIQPLLGQSVLFQEPLDLLRIGSNLGMVWATERSGKIVVFDPRVFERSGMLRNSLKACVDPNEQ